jgi:uncharacterized protein YoxC
MDDNDAIKTMLICMTAAALILAVSVALLVVYFVRTTNTLLVALQRVEGGIATSAEIIAEITTRTRTIEDKTTRGQRA